MDLILVEGYNNAGVYTIQVKKRSLGKYERCW